jgi:hypothetical protein
MTGHTGVLDQHIPTEAHDVVPTQARQLVIQRLIGEAAVREENDLHT